MPMAIFRNFLALYQLYTIINAQFDPPDLPCNDTSALWVHPGESIKIDVPVSPLCEIAAFSCQGREPADIDINRGAACNDSDSGVQTFEIQLSNTLPAGEARVLFLCGQLVSESFCQRFQVDEQPIPQGFTTNQILASCSSSGNGTTLPTIFTATSAGATAFPISSLAPSSMPQSSEPINTSTTLLTQPLSVSSGQSAQTSTGTGTSTALAATGTGGIAFSSQNSTASCTCQRPA